MAWKNEQDKINYQKEYWIKNKIRLLKQNKKYYEKNKRHISYMNWKLQIKKQFGIDEEDYNFLLKLQNKRCAICGRKEKAKVNGVVKRLAVDHSHKTGKVRGLLCSKCNGTLGWYEICRKKIESYLKSN